MAAEPLSAKLALFQIMHGWPVVVVNIERGWSPEPSHELGGCFDSPASWPRNRQTGLEGAQLSEPQLRTLHLQLFDRPSTILSL